MFPTATASTVLAASRLSSRVSRPFTAKTKVQSARLLAAFAGAVGLAALTASSYAQWAVTSLNPLSCPEAIAFATTGSQQAGRALINDNFHAGVWSGTAASWVDLHDPGWGDSWIYAASDNQQGGFVDVGPLRLASLWSGTSGSWVNLDPGQGSSIVFAMDGGRQGGVALVNTMHASLWSGTAASWVDLHPAGLFRSRVLGMCGTQQVGYASATSAPSDAACMWTGTADSYVNLAPAGSTFSNATSTNGTQQGGWSMTGGVLHASLWNGTAASLVDMNPANASDSRILAMSGAYQAGTFTSSGFSRACVWNGTPSSCINLHSFLPSQYYASEAHAIWTRGVETVITGFAERSGGRDAVVWTRISDECVVHSASEDCNNNGIADACETLVFSNSDFTTDLAAQGWTINGSSSVQLGEGAIQLTPPTTGQMGTLIHAPLTTGVTQRLRASFDFRISETSTLPADGIAFSLMDADAVAPSAWFGEDGLSVPGTVTVKFNTYRNTPAEASANSIHLRYDGVDVASNIALPLTLADGAWHRAMVEITPDGHVTVQVSATPNSANPLTAPITLTTVLDHVPIPGYVPHRHLVGFGARTGAQFARHAITNVRLAVNGPNDLNANAVPDVCCPLPTIFRQPSGDYDCVPYPSYVVVDVISSTPVTYQWQWRSFVSGADWIDIVAGLNSDPFGSTAHFTTANAHESGLLMDAPDSDGTPWETRCIVSNPCGAVITGTAVIEHGFPVAITSQPQSVQTCPHSTVTFTVGVSGTPPFYVEWYRGGQYIDPSENPSAATPTLTLTNVSQSDAGRYVGWVANDCGFGDYFNRVTLTICVADTDDGNGSGTCDGGVTIDDLLFYLASFENGDLRSDVDDGSGTGTPDDGVTIDDLLYYLQRFEAGC